MALEVLVLDERQILFKGEAQKVIVPGEEGAFEILVYHKPIFSRLLSGKIMIDKNSFALRRGIVKCYQNKVTIILEEV